MKNLKIPRIQLYNIVSNHKRMRLSADGHVYLESEISADLSCSMQYKNFSDVQVKKSQNGSLCNVFKHLNVYVLPW